MCRTATVSKTYGGLLAGIVVVAFFLIGAYGLSQTSENILLGSGSLPRSTESYPEPTVSVPETGLYQSHVNKECVANFTITSDANSSLYFIKLVDVSDVSNVVTLFVNPGDTAGVKVPLGSYEMLCATGNQWYGTRYLFGPDTSYSTAADYFVFEKDSSGAINSWSVDMTPQESGNLHMNDVSKGKW